MLDALQRKHIVQLQNDAAYRNLHQIFVVEGIKLVQELLQTQLKCNKIYATEKIAAQLKLPKFTEIISEKYFAMISTQKTPQGLLALVKFPEKKMPTNYENWLIALDGVQDPGNMGSIIRTADWFGIQHVISSPLCVNVFNPKVIQASMGSVFRILVHEMDLDIFFQKNKLPVAAGILGGNNLYQTQLPGKGVLLMGNESKGVSKNLQKYIDFSLEIPRFGAAESLNVALATAIFCSEIKRNVAKY